ncbi:MAG: hypothetical protein GXO71_06275 [Caldiserica bacterium]|nr:hypothetical protein [Caldisericota bacterium]
MAGLKVPPHYVFLADSLLRKLIYIKRRVYFSPRKEDIQCISSLEEMGSYIDNCFRRFSRLTSLMTKRTNRMNNYLQNRSSTPEDADKFTDWMLYPLQEMADIYWNARHMEFSPSYWKLYPLFIRILERPIKDVFQFMEEFIDIVKYPERRVKDSPVFTLTLTLEIDREVEEFSNMLQGYQAIKELSEIQQQAPVRRGFSIWDILGVWFLFKLFRRD